MPLASADLSELALLLVDHLSPPLLNDLVLCVRSPTLLAVLLERERVRRAVDVNDLIDHHLVLEYSEPMLNVVRKHFLRELAKAIVKEDYARAFQFLDRAIMHVQGAGAVKEKILEYAYRYRSIDALCWLHRRFGVVTAEKLISNDIVLWGAAFEPTQFPAPTFPENIVELAVSANAINTLDFLHKNGHKFPETLSASARTCANAGVKKWLRKNYPALCPIFCF
jgi:hypothetical protein